jgi:hypothetical protein
MRIFNGCDMLADVTHPNISAIGSGGEDTQTTTLLCANVETPKAVIVKTLGLFGTNKLAGKKILGLDADASS